MYNATTGAFTNYDYEFKTSNHDYPTGGWALSWGFTLDSGGGGPKHLQVRLSEVLFGATASDTT
jgi:hypothetical protein